MAEIRRQSPVRFKATPLKSEKRDHWDVVLEYNEEGDGPWLVDLSHKIRWDLQNGEIDRLSVGELAVPVTAGQCILAGRRLINRMNATQVSIYHLGADAPEMPDGSGYTDVTEATLCVALFGPQTFQVAEKLTSLDFMDSAKQPPFLLQGPFCNVPCQIVILEKEDNDYSGFLLTCSRGYGESMVDAILDAGASFGLTPAGEKRFNLWLKGLQKKYS